MIAAKQLGKKKKIILIIVLIGSLLVTVFAITSNTIFKKPTRPVPAPAPAAGSASLRRIQQELPLEVLETESYQSLRKYGNWPVAPGQKGKANPFLPVFTGE